MSRLQSRKPDRRTTRPLGGIVPGTLGFYRLHALCEALLLMEWKANDLKKVMWDHTMAPHVRKYLFKTGKLVKLDDITSIRDYVINRGDILMELNAGTSELSNGR